MIRHVYYVNCDCGSYWDTRMRPVKSGCWPRCRQCRKQLGWEIEYVGRMQGKDEQECLDRAQKLFSLQMKKRIAKLRASRLEGE